MDSSHVLHQRWNSQIDLLSESLQILSGTCHLPPDYDLVSVVALKDKAAILRAKNHKVGLNEGDEVIYEPMKVAQQVRK